MGSSKPQTVEYELPSAREIKKAGLGPQQFLQEIPGASFRYGGEYGNYLTNEVNRLGDLNAQAYGSSSEIGARGDERRALSAASYAASLPYGDKYIPGPSSGGSYGTEESDPYAQIRDLTQATYASALADAAKKREFANSGAEAALSHQPYNPVLEKFASGDYKGPYRVSESKVRSRKGRSQRQERRRNAIA